MDKSLKKKNRYMKRFIRFAILFNDPPNILPSIFNRYAYHRLEKLHKKIKSGRINKKILLELLENDNPRVSLSAACHMLRLSCETNKAMNELYKIGKTKYEELKLRGISFSAQISYIMYKKYGYFPVKSSDFEWDSELLHAIFD